MKRRKQQLQHCSNGQSNGIQQQQQLHQQKVYVSLYPQMMSALEPNYETLARQQQQVRETMRVTKCNRGGKQVESLL